MKLIPMMFAAGTFALLAGCGSDGIEFNGQAQVEQFPVRTVPIDHYQLPSEDIDPVTGKALLIASYYANIDMNTFPELVSPGHDLWGMFMDTYQCADNPTCRTPAEVPDWVYMFDGGYTAAGVTGNIVWPPGGSWPHPQLQGPGGSSRIRIAGWIMSLMHQHFLREVDGTEIPQPSPNEAPVRIESLNFGSMPISIHEVINGSNFSNLPFNTPPGAAAQETGDPATTGANGNQRIQTPVNNILAWTYDGNNAPAGLLGMTWHEAPAQNIHIETNLAAVGNAIVIMPGVPVPDYHGGGSIPSSASGGGGVFTRRVIDRWWQTTDGNANIAIDDGVLFSYYASVVGCHLVGYGLGLLSSSFAKADVIDDQEDIMALSVILDISAFIASEKEFQFTPEDLVRMQDVVNGDWQNPGPKSTLPGRDR